MKSRDQILLEEAYQSIHTLLENKKLAQQLVDQGKLSQAEFEDLFGQIKQKKL